MNVIELLVFMLLLNFENVWCIFVIVWVWLLVSVLMMIVVLLML